MASANRTLRARLLRRLLGPLLVLLAIGAGFNHWRAALQARDEQDLALQRVAIALASRLDVDADDVLDEDLGAHLERTMAAMQRTSASGDRLDFVVHDREKHLLGGDPLLIDIADPDSLDEPGFHDRTLRRMEVRVVTFPHVSPIGKVWVVVAETTHRRDQQARWVLIESLAANLILIGLALWLVRSGVLRAMRPLSDLSRDVAQRAQDDLTALPTHRLPGELVPLVGSINGLMAHLRAAAIQQQTFLSNAAHQLRTPLAGVQTQLELTMTEAPDAQRPRLEKVQRAIQRITHTTHQMLALARSGPQARQAITFEPVDLCQLLEAAATDWLDEALRMHVDLGFEVEPVHILGSPWMLRELLGNLLANALRHSPAGGRVTVGCGPDAVAGVGVLRVDDEGPGIPPELREKVLERFYQAPNAARGGSGLGLSIVQEVAARHGGTLALEDAPGGRGLRVRVTLPLAPTPAGETREHRGPPSDTRNGA